MCCCCCCCCCGSNCCFGHLSDSLITFHTLHAQTKNVFFSFFLLTGWARCFTQETGSLTRTPLLASPQTMPHTSGNVLKFCPRAIIADLFAAVLGRRVCLRLSATRPTPFQMYGVLNPTLLVVISSYAIDWCRARQDQSLMCAPA